MVDSQHVDNSVYRIVLRPNQSLSWRAACYFWLSMVVVCGGIATGLTVLGFWPVLPFAGLELGALAVVLYVVAWRSEWREVIAVTDDAIQIERGHRRPEQCWTLAKTWARVILERCPKQWYPSRLLIRSHGHSVEVGGFLNEDERRQVADELVRRLAAFKPADRVPANRYEHNNP